MSAVKKGDSVRIHYTGTLQDGTVFDSSANREPLAFTLGAGQVIPGFEDAVMGMKQGESKKVTIPVEKAYGPRNEELIMPFPRNQVPPDLDPQVGQNLQLGGPNGEPIMVSVAEITDEHIILDANPPLAGKELTFDIELVAIG
ncbi:MAG: peptidylprolyl isomerase [Desulfobulbaceae bacterium DB1]|nr:MAG: peptidylprolyl isomerase [Desulfobulbaceae bacterium DB1]